MQWNGGQPPIMRAGRQEVQHPLHDRPKHGGGLPDVARKQAVVGGPVDELSAGGTEQTGDRVPAQAGQLAQAQLAGALGGALLGKGVPAFVPQGQHLRQQV